eukprot:5182745-Karenia_brevis.AAC.1
MHEDFNSQELADRQSASVARLRDSNSQELVQFEAGHETSAAFDAKDVNSQNHLCNVTSSERTAYHGPSPPSGPWAQFGWD